MDDIYNVNDGKALPLMKQEIQEKMDKKKKKRRTNVKE